MAFKLKSAELQDVVFVGGKNMPAKLTDVYCKDHGITLFYERSPDGTTTPELWIVYKGEITCHPYTVVKSYQPSDYTEAGVDTKAVLGKIPKIKPPPAPTTPIKAQVGAPPGLKI